jgi:o-succinylbenzoate synthase
VNRSKLVDRECTFQFRPYDRPFHPPLRTQHGRWSLRQSIIVRLSDATGQVGFGEIAPLAWFGSETLQQALEFCDRQSTPISLEQILAIPNHLPACQFGFESAWEMLRCDSKPLAATLMCGLLPAGKAALEAWQTLYHQGDRTFKWKIAVDAPETEIKLYQQLVEQLPAGVKLRLDANGGLDWRSANLWLQVCDPSIVEFLEQPLPVSEFANLLALSCQSPIPIALDESVATIDQLAACYQKGWRGVFVIKPAIAGSPRRLRQFCQQHSLDLVFSSVFESAIGRQTALRLAAELGSPDRALGFGVNHWFEPDSVPQPATVDDLEALWHRL